MASPEVVPIAFFEANNINNLLRKNFERKILAGMGGGENTIVFDAERVQRTVVRDINSANRVQMSQKNQKNEKHG